MEKISCVNYLSRLIYSILHELRVLNLHTIVSCIIFVMIYGML